jgi:hypothetical protein
MRVSNPSAVLSSLPWSGRHHSHGTGIVNVTFAETYESRTRSSPNRGGIGKKRPAPPAILIPEEGRPDLVPRSEGQEWLRLTGCRGDRLSE